MSASPFFVLLSLCLLLSGVLPLASAWSTGSGTCDADATAVLSRTTRHPLASTMQFYLQLPTSYTPGSTYNVSIANTGRQPSISYFNGFLLYAEDPSGRRVGSFAPRQDATTNMGAAAEADLDPSTQQSTCYSAPGATVTHSGGGIKEPPFTLQWRAPSSDVGRLTWRGLVESSGVQLYLQVLPRQPMCPPGDGSCPAFNTSTLPSGPLPQPPNSNYLPLGLFPNDRTACGEFDSVPFSAVPPGFCVSVYANNLARPRGMFVTSHGDLLVVETGYNRDYQLDSGVTLLRDLNGNGRIDHAVKGEYLRLFTQPGLNHGLYVRGDHMYVSSPTTVWRLPFRAWEPWQPLTAANATVVVKNLPPPANHGTRTPLVDSAGRWLYVSIGSAGNLDDDDRRARVVRYDLSRTLPQGGWQWDDYAQSGGAVQAFAKGLRNEVGLALDLYGEVWGVMNADDNLNRPDLGGYAIHNDNPSERLDHLREDRMDGWYGYPYCWAVDVLANHTRGEIFAWGGDGKNWYRDGTHDDEWCRQNTIPPTYALQAHTAPLGLAFYDGRGKYGFPPEYFQQVFISQHGSWNSDNPRGYKMTRVETDERGQPIFDSARDFFAYEGPGAISGNWPHKPVDTRVGSSGELFWTTSDSGDGTVMAARYLNPQHRPVLISQPAASGARLSSPGGPTLPAADFSFERPPYRSVGLNFRWDNGSDPHLGLALFDGATAYVNLTSSNSGAGAVMPQWTGGDASFELWLWAEEAQADARTVLLELCDNRTGRADDVIQLALAGRLGDERAGLSVVLSSTDGGGDVDYEVRDAVALRRWTHVVVTMEPRALSVYVDGRLAAPAQFLRAPPRRMHRPVATLARGVVGAQPLRMFRGAVDVLRVYPWALSPAQVALNFALSNTTTLHSPSLYAHFAMAPMDSSEATFEHRSARRGGRPPVLSAQPPPPPADELFEGWAHFSGDGSFVDLRNPNNGVSGGAVWPRSFLDTGAFTIELWLRADAQNPPPYLQWVFWAGVGVNPIVALTLDGGALRFNVSTTGGQAGIRLQSPDGLAQWHHVVWSCVAGADAARHDIHWDGQRVLSAPTQPLALVQPTDVAYLAARFVGDVGAFRVYPSALSGAVVRALYEAQVWGHALPQPTASSSSSSAAPAWVTSVTSAPLPVPTSAPVPTAAPTFPWTSIVAPTSVPVTPPSSIPAPTSAPASPTAAPWASSSTGGTGEEEKTSLASTIAIVLLVVILLVAAVAGVVYCVRRRRAATGSDRSAPLMSDRDTGDAYSRL